VNMTIYHRTSLRHRTHIMGCVVACVALALIALPTFAAAAPEGEVRATFERFVMRHL
jgi:hypothetical protein